MRPLRASLRFVIFLVLSLCTIAHLILGLAWLRIRNASQVTKREWIHRRFKRFVRRVQFIMGLEVTWEGQFPNEPAVLMGNHRSYVDAVLFPVEFPVVYVGRVESKSWPVIGWGATLLGTIWVNRKDKDSRRATRAAVRDRLSEGMGIVIFPEGTTFKGPELLDYRPGMFYTCAEEGFPIVPVALEYRDPNIAWVDNVWFLPHAFNHFGAKKIEVTVRIGDAVKMTDAEGLRAHVRNWTEAQCLDLRKRYDNSN